jgi:DNA-binding HxlR family transcriptional regulator
MRMVTSFCVGELIMREAAFPVKNAPRSKYDEREITCERFVATQALKRLAGLWKTPVLLVLFEGPKRFADLERELAPISAKVLTQRLKELERAGFVVRLELVSEPPKVVEYRLAPLGEALRPAFDALVAWERSVRSVGSSSEPDHTTSPHHGAMAQT